MKMLITTLANGPRRIFILLLAAGFTLTSASANHKSSALNLKMFGSGRFSIVLDNQPGFSKSGFFTAPAIEPGYHKLKVVRLMPTHPGYPPMQEVVYKGWISIPPKSVVYASITHHHQFNVVKVEPHFCPPAGGCGNGWHHDGCDGFCGNGCDDEYGYGYNNGHEGNGWSGGNGYENPGPPPVYMGMSPVEFMQLKKSVESANFETSKLQVAKQALSHNEFTSAQVADLMTSFSFESTRLDFAKMAYSKVVDKKNYHVVNNSFSYSSSIQELTQYMAMGK
jgi:hypothetical protein